MTERDKNIINLYLNAPEISNKEIAKLFNVSCATISRIARINNLPRRAGHSKTYLSQNDIQNIKIKYLNGISLLALQRQYNISYERIKNIVKDCEEISYAKRLNINIQENYFHQINSNEKAYWLGWIISDGSITYQPSKSKYQLELTIKQEDEDILHLLEKDLCVENKVYTTQGKYKRFSLGSKQIVSDLINQNITQNKSFTVQVPNFDKKYNAAFIRGLFDGDGGFTVYTRKTGKKCMELSFCGNQYIISWVRDTLYNEIPALTHNEITDMSTIKRIRWSKKEDIILIRNYLYAEHNNHFLTRKYKLIYANTETTS